MTRYMPGNFKHADFHFEDGGASPVPLSNFKKLLEFQSAKLAHVDGNLWVHSYYTLKLTLR